MGYFSYVGAEVKTEGTGKKVVFNVEENAIVGDISIKGCTKVKNEILLDAMESKIGTVFNSKLLTQDIQHVNDALGREGYLFSKVSDAYVQDQGSKINIEITEGILADVKIEGLKKRYRLGVIGGGTLQGGFMNCGSYSGQGIYCYASPIPSFFRAGFTFSQYGGAAISVEDGEAIVDLTIAGNISWSADSWNSISKNGSGTLRMTGTSGGTSSQPFQLNAGTLLCDNASGTPVGNTLLNVKAGARIHGTFTVGSTTQTNLVSLGASTKLVIGAGARDPATRRSGVDKLLVHGALEISENATLDLVSHSAADPTTVRGGTYTIVEADKIVGSFETVVKPKASWQIAYETATVEGDEVVTRITLTVPSDGTVIVVR